MDEGHSHVRMGSGRWINYYWNGIHIQFRGWQIKNLWLLYAYDFDLSWNIDNFIDPLDDLGMDIPYP